MRIKLLFTDQLKIKYNLEKSSTDIMQLKNFYEEKKVLRLFTTICRYMMSV